MLSSKVAMVAMKLFSFIILAALAIDLSPIEFASEDYMISSLPNPAIPAIDKRYSNLTRKLKSRQFQMFKTPSNVKPAATTYLRQPFFNSFRTILKGILKQFLSEFEVPSEHLKPILVTIPVIGTKIQMHIIRLKINSIESNKTNFTITDGVLWLTANDVKASISGDFRLEFGMYDLTAENSTTITGSVNTSSTLSAMGDVSFYTTPNFELGVSMSKTQVPIKDLAISVKTDKFNWLINLCKIVFHGLIKRIISNALSVLLSTDLMDMLTVLLNKQIFLGSLNIISVGGLEFRTSVHSSSVSVQDGLKVKLGLEHISK